MIKYTRHTDMQRFFDNFNNFYLENKQLWEIDNSWDGYEWIATNQGDTNAISYKRKAIDGDELYVVINFSPITRPNYPILVDEDGEYEEVFTTDDFKFGGNGIVNNKLIKSKNSPANQKYIEINLPALSGVIVRKVSRRVRRG